MKSTHTLLTELNLDNVGMGDQGLVALASLIDQGRLVQLEALNVSGNESVTDQGYIALARAIDIGGLSNLSMLQIYRLAKLTGVGISAISLAVIKGCPQLEEIDLEGSGPGDGSHRDAITGMLEATGRVGKVKVIYDKEDGEEDEDEDLDDEDDEEEDD